jgi:hypothetical protein
VTGRHPSSPDPPSPGEGRSEADERGDRDDRDDLGVALVVDDVGLQDLDGVLRRARRAGLRGAQVLESIGIITGTAAPDAVEPLSRLRGVRTAEVERTIHLPPPDQPQ